MQDKSNPTDHHLQAKHHTPTEVCEKHRLYKNAAKWPSLLRRARHAILGEKPLGFKRSGATESQSA